METYGEGSWSKLVPYFSGRIGKQLRERWNHELRPDIQKGAWTEDEERALVEQHRIHRNAWADIARVSPALLFEPVLAGQSCTINMPLSISIALSFAARTCYLVVLRGCDGITL